MKRYNKNNNLFYLSGTLRDKLIGGNLGLPLSFITKYGKQSGNQRITKKLAVDSKTLKHDSSSEYVGFVKYNYWSPEYTFYIRAVRNFIKGAVHRKFPGVVFEDYVTLIYFLKKFDPNLRISPQSISNLKTRKLVFSNIRNTERIGDFLDYIKEHFPGFQDEWLFFPDLIEQLIDAREKGDKTAIEKGDKTARETGDGHKAAVFYLKDKWLLVLNFWLGLVSLTLLVIILGYHLTDYLGETEALNMDGEDIFTGEKYPVTSPDSLERTRFSGVFDVIANPDKYIRVPSYKQPHHFYSEDLAGGEGALVNLRHNLSTVEMKLKAYNFRIIFQFNKDLAELNEKTVKLDEVYSKYNENLARIDKEVNDLRNDRMADGD